MDYAPAVKAYNKMVILTKIIDETKNNYERGDRVRQIRLMIKRWKDKTNVIYTYKNKKRKRIYRRNRFEIIIVSKNNPATYFNYRTP